VSFVAPAEFGFDRDRLDSAGTAISARLGNVPGEDTVGYFVHFFRDRPEGCEYRTRFFPKGAPDIVGRELFGHCVGKYGHLASFLHRLHAKVTSVIDP